MPFAHLCFVRPASELKMSDRQEAIEKVKRRIKEIREKAAEKYSEDEITQKITDAFNGKVCYLPAHLALLQYRTPPFCK